MIVFAWASTAWSGVPGEALGRAGAKQWAIPWGFELNSVSYNRRIFDTLKLTPPTNLPDMVEKAAKIIEVLGDVVATPADARQILGLQAAAHVRADA